MQPILVICYYRTCHNIGCVYSVCKNPISVPILVPTLYSVINIVPTFIQGGYFDSYMQLCWRRSFQHHGTVGGEEVFCVYAGNRAEGNTTRHSSRRSSRRPPRSSAAAAATATVDG